MLLKIKIFFLLLVFIGTIKAKECSPYYNPDRFYESPSYLQELLDGIKITKEIVEFDIEKSELYKYNDYAIAAQINDEFGGFWNDWTGDAYEMKLTPEQTLFRYNEFYFSLEVFIYGTIGDATKLKGTKIKYHFYNYTNEVNKYLKCKGKK